MPSRQTACAATPALVAVAVTSAALLAGCGTVPASSPQAHGAQSAEPSKSVAPPAKPSASPHPVQPAGAHCGASAALHTLHDNTDESALFGVQFVSPSQGWVVGTRQILATTNGGASWHVQDTGNLNLASVDFIGNDVGWAVGADTVLTTSDGGQHWTALPEPCPVIRSVHFVSAKVGFAIAGGSQVSNTLAPESGGKLLASTDGGHSWRRLAAPPNPQSMCFTSSTDGWLGAGGGLYRTTDGGSTWTRAVAAPDRRDAGYPFAMIAVQCAGPSSAWALDAGSGAASSQSPHIGYHAGPAGAKPIFAEQYFPHPGISVTANAPGSYPGTLSAISASQAAYVEYCPACGYGTAPWALATASGAALKPAGKVGGITVPDSASFLTPSTGWVVGVLTKNGADGTSRSYSRIMHTDDGGRTWRVQFSSG